MADLVIAILRDATDAVEEIQIAASLSAAMTIFTASGPSADDFTAWDTGWNPASPVPEPAIGNSYAYDSVGDALVEVESVIIRDTIALTKTGKKKKLLMRYEAYLATRYSDADLLVIGLIYTKAVNDKATARENHIVEILDWIKTVRAYYITQRDLVDSQATLILIDGVAYNFAQYDATDPLNTIESALAI